MPKTTSSIVDPGSPVHNGDLIVADDDERLAIPQAVEDDVINRAMQKVAGENDVREVLRQGTRLQQIFREYGVPYD